MSSFLRQFDALPTDAQLHLARAHIAPLIDVAPSHTRKRIAAATAAMHRRFARMPALDLKAKKAEIAALLHELSRDAKRSLLKERSRRDQIISEAVHSLASWLTDIWRVSYEFRANFSLAHSCLLYACDALEQIANASAGQVHIYLSPLSPHPFPSCRCTYVTMFVPLTITRSTGKLVKSFVLTGAHNLESIVLWVWRDLFITILATGTTRQKRIVPDMIKDISTLLGWPALEHLLRGGTKSFFAQDRHANRKDLDFFDFEDDEDDNDDDEGEDEDEDSCSSDHASCMSDDLLHPATFYAPHWSLRITDQQPRLRDFVHTALLDIFKVAPSAPLYFSMVAISDDQDDMQERLHPILISVAGYSSENLSAALRILSLNNRTDTVDKLLKAHKHLLRPQDAAPLQFAVLVMSSNPSCRSHAISIAEEELLDVSNLFRAAIRISFCNIGSETNKADLTQLLTLPRDSLNRRNRVQRWVKAVLTPQADNTHPMALAALMIGIPLPPGVQGTDDADMLGFFEVDGDDPEVEDLREEFRPNIKARFQGWHDTSVAIKGGPVVLRKVYAKVIDDMPFLKAKDVVEEMSARIADRPSKLHVSDALQAFKEFCETQRQKLAVAAAKAKRAKEAASADTSHALNPIEGVD